MCRRGKARKIPFGGAYKKRSVSIIRTNPIQEKSTRKQKTGRLIHPVLLLIFSHNSLYKANELRFIAINRAVCIIFRHQPHFAIL